MILRKVLSFVWLCGIALLPLVGCSSDDNGTTPDTNNPPTVMFTVDKVAVPLSSSVTLTAVAEDPDDDPITITWSVTRGSLDPGDQGGTTIPWLTPSTTGVDTITIEAADGRGGSATITEIIKVGRLWTGAIDPPGATWTMAQSPYILNPTADRFFINPGATLTVEPGVEIYIDRAGLEINLSNAELATSGTTSESVTILPNTRNPEAGWWQGIFGRTEVDAARPCVINLTGARIGYATNAVHASDWNRIEDGTRISLSNCDIKFSSENAVLHEASGALEVEGSRITSNPGTGIRVQGGLLFPEYVVISGDSIAANGDLTGATPYEDHAGILIDLDDPLNYVSIDISGNEISRNGYPGIQLSQGVFPGIRYNAIFRNEFGMSGNRINVKLTNDFGSQGGQDTIDARCNYWGGVYPNPADSVMIKAGIRDAADNPTILVDVIVTPWLSEWPPVTLPPDCQ